MSAGRSWIKELYVGFLLLALTFLYLSHLNAETKASQRDEPGLRTELLVPAMVMDEQDFANT